MFVSCFFCTEPFESHGSIGSCSVGRIFAFEPPSRRVWVICRRCRRWNLLPDEERPAVVEDCERRFADARMRTATDNVSLAELRDGTELIRIGDASPGEITHWRYGKQLIRRRKQLAIRVAVGVATAAALLYAGLIPSIIAVSVIAAAANVGTIMYSRRICARLRLGERALRLSRHSIAHVELRPNVDHGFELRIPYLDEGRYDLATVELWARNWLSSSKYASIILCGRSAWPAAQIILPVLNSAGGTPADVSEAMTLIELYRTPERLWTALAATKRSWLPALWGHERGGSAMSVAAFRLGRLRLAQRLALEISIQTAVENEDMNPTLGDLQAHWTEAVEIAEIADHLLDGSQKKGYMGEPDTDLKSGSSASTPKRE